MDPIIAAAIVFLAVFTQSLTGFGIALVAMALLPGILGLKIAAPLVALVGLTLEIILLIRYHSALRLEAIWRLALASLPGIPLGIFALRQVDEEIILTILGLVLAGYALYAFANVRLPELKNPAWAYFFGFLAGALGGAYNTSGPPAVVYANFCRWPPAEFKSNLQGFFILNSLLVVSGHALSESYTPQVLSLYVMVLPGLALGVLLGISLDRWINPEIFRRIVLAMTLLMGLRLVL